MGIKDFEINFKIILESKTMSRERKKELLLTFLDAIDEIFLKEPDSISLTELKRAENLYSQIQHYLNN